MLGISAEAWGAIGTILGVVGTIASVVYGRLAAADKRAHVLEMEQISKDLARMDASLKAAWAILDDLRFTSVRRADLDKQRDEFRADIKALGDRLVAEITSLRNDIHNRPQGGQ